MSDGEFDHLLIRHILTNSGYNEWSVQGLGMFRLYLSKTVRLHVWDDRYIVPNVSTIHNHPWSFKSHIICGDIRNTVYETEDYESLQLNHPNRKPTHSQSLIKCGMGGGVVKGLALHDKMPDVRLKLKRTEIYRAGVDHNYYWQHEDEIHESFPTRGTITLVERTFSENTENAQVFYPVGTPWVSAEPRNATEEEVDQMLESALARLAGEDRLYRRKSDY